MPFTEEDRILIKHYRLDKGYGATRILKEFPFKDWSLGGLKKLLNKIDRTGTHKRLEGSGRPKSARTDENIKMVEELVLSQEDQPHTHIAPRRIAAQLQISRTSVRNIIKQDLKLRPFKRMHGHKITPINEQKRTTISRRMLSIITPEKLNKTFFSDEKKFTVEPPKNS